MVSFMFSLKILHSEGMEVSSQERKSEGGKLNGFLFFKMKVEILTDKTGSA